MGAKTEGGQSHWQNVVARDLEMAMTGRLDGPPAPPLTALPFGSFHGDNGNKRQARHVTGL